MRTKDQLRGIRIVARDERVEAALWRRLKTEGENEVREQLFNLHRNLARSIARSYARRARKDQLAISDLEQAAYRGLLEAIDRFDPYLQVPFAAFARSRISGSVTDAAAQLNEAGAQYAHDRKRSRERLRSIAGDEQQSKGSALDRLGDIAVQLALSLMLEAEEREAGSLGHRKENAFDTLAWRQMVAALARHVDELPGTERTVIVQHYHNDILFADIAAMLGISKGRVSQLHKSALQRMAKKMRGMR